MNLEIIQYFANRQMLCDSYKSIYVKHTSPSSSSMNDAHHGKVWWEYSGIPWRVCISLIGQDDPGNFMDMPGFLISPNTVF